MEQLPRRGAQFYGSGCFLCPAPVKYSPKCIKEALINSMLVIPAQSLPLRKQGPESSNDLNGNTPIPALRYASPGMTS
jgi:hypothetical protein